MHLRIIITLTFLCLMPCCVVNAQEWESLFDGKSLTGWKANNDAESFKVVDGLLRTHAVTKRKSHLFYEGEKNKFRNFELKATVRAEPNSNGGIFFHTDMATRDRHKHLANGYEVQLNSSKKEARKTGSLYGIVDYHKSPVDETKWFEVYIKVIDKQIVVNINGDQVIDYTEPENPMRTPSRKGRVLLADGGMIALQAHDTNSVWYFREIKIKRLK